MSFCGSINLENIFFPERKFQENKKATPSDTLSVPLKISRLVWLYGPSGETRTPGILLPKQARYQLRYTRLWNCFICGLSCGLGRFLTNNFVELVPASGSVPAGCGLRLFPSWMRPACSQSKRATNCATPGFLRLPSTVCQGREPTAYQDRLLLYWTHSV